ncbi:sulfurtransferase complex subunit TusC [bacterium]|nr:sulfurtransferase complex subunit TusC [bacterium]
MPITCLMRHAPYGTDRAHESLEALLAMAIFDPQIHAIWLDDGIFQITAHHEAHTIGRKNFNAMARAFELYDLSHCYACQTSLRLRGFGKNDIIEGVTVAEPDQLKTLLHNATAIVSL